MVYINFWFVAQVIVHLTRLINSKTLCLGRHCICIWSSDLSNTSVNRQSNWSRLFYVHLSSKFESKQITLDLWIYLWPTELMSWVTLIDNLHQKNGKNTSNLVTCNWAMKHYLVAVPESCCRRSKKTVLPRYCWVVGWTLGDSRGGSRRLTSSGTREGTSRNCPGHRLITRLQKAKLIMREQLSYLLVVFFSYQTMIRLI